VLGPPRRRAPGRRAHRRHLVDRSDLRHADDSVYGAPANPRAAAILLSDVHQALTGLGFKEREARRMVETIRPHVGAEATIEDALRRALRGWQALSATA